MAYDYGSIDLGIRNPFKKEGAVKAVRGLIIAALGIYLLMTAVAVVKDDMTLGRVFIAFGLWMLGGGLTVLASGVMAMLRYFVGRSEPSSLAENMALSDEERKKESVAYTTLDLVEMLKGRVNKTFKEPNGLLARLLHSIFPALTCLPPVLINITQRIFSAWVTTVVALVAYGFIAFVTFGGFVGEQGEQVFTAYTVFLTLFLAATWFHAGRALTRILSKQVEPFGGLSLFKAIAIGIIAPVFVSVFLADSLFSFKGISNDYFPNISISMYLFVIIGGAIVASILIFSMLRKRMAHASPKTEVSELRENWQESVHPNDLFINLKNLVMADRRYKEVPNRVYADGEPNIQQTDKDKGTFFGGLVQEIQPCFKPLDLGPLFNRARMLALVVGNVLFVVSAVLMTALVLKAGDGYTLLQALNISDIEEKDKALLVSLVETMSHLLLALLIARIFGRLLTNTAHVFIAEMQFESDLIYITLEGTFNETTYTSGAGIHDSTRSESIKVNSSITPWIMVSRLVSSTFAATGLRNLEYKRHIMEMHRNDSEAEAIRDELVAFIKGRETVASISSEQDLQSVAMMNDLNQHSRAIPEPQPNNALQHSTEEAAGQLIQEG